MTADQIIRRLSPEEEELASKRNECALLQNQLAERELYLANLRAELTAFEGRYLRQVGVLYAELDEWTAKIAELMAERDRTESSRSTAAEARTRAGESHAAAHGAAAELKEFAASSELKSLYREVAKRVHPDLATDEVDRKLRERLMAEANQAFERSDADALRRILDEYESSPESVRGAGVASDLVRVVRQIRQVRNRLSQIEEEIASLSHSEIALLKKQAEEAQTLGRDLLAEMATGLKGRINVARKRHETEASQMRTER